MNSFADGAMNVLRGDHTLLKKALQDLVSAAFQVLVRFFVEVAMGADEFDQGFFVQCHMDALSVLEFWPSGLFYHIVPPTSLLNYKIFATYVIQ